MVAVKDRFGESGEPDELMKEFGLVAKDIKEAIQKSNQKEIVDNF